MKRFIYRLPLSRWMLAAALGTSVLLSGCARHYDITTSNGLVVRARTKPVLNDEGYYVFEDLAGKQKEVNRLRVRQIEAVRRGSQPSRPF